MNTYYLQIYYHEQDSQVVDTAVFTVPTSVGRRDFFTALDSVMIQYALQGTDSDQDYLDVTDEMLSLIADKLGGTWAYLKISFTMYVDGDGRGLHKC